MNLLRVVICRPSLRRLLVKSNASGWSARVQLTGQWRCNWVVKSMQLRNSGRLPFMRQQLVYFTRPLRRQTRENILQVNIRIMPVETRRLDQTHDRCRPFAATQRPCEEPVLASKCPRPDLVVG